MSTFKDEVIELCKSYVTANKKVPNRIHISPLKAYDLCALTANDLGPEAMDALMMDGPHAMLEDWGFMGLKVVWLTDYVALGMAVSCAEQKRDSDAREQAQSNRGGRSR